jgi:general nucleoside transport system ATP-binding protein
MSSGQTGRRHRTVSAIDLVSLTKTFGPTVACAAVSVSFQAGRIHALLGENGAGKSTLMSMLSGLFPPDSGEIRVDGTPVEFHSPADALQAGIGMVYQHFKLFDDLSVADNLFAGRKRALPPLLSAKGRTGRAGAICKRYGVSLGKANRVGDLAIADRQQLEIVRLLARGTSVLIFDEPTAVLSPQESARLFELLIQLRNDGHLVILITHKLQEVIDVSDSITVMRQGSVVANLDTADTSIDELARLMIGRHLSTANVKEPPPEFGGSVLSLNDVHALGALRAPALTGVTLEVKSGEIVGLGGVTGNGQSELIEVLAGTRRLSSGTISVGGVAAEKIRPRTMHELGLGLVPEERNDVGLARALSLWENLILKNYREHPIRRGPLLLRRVAIQKAEQLTREIAKAWGGLDLRRTAGTLSGGQAQRILLNREVAVARTALVLAYPTRGLDVGASVEVWEAVLQARNTGLGVLVISEDIEALIGIADRISIMYAGSIIGEVSTENPDRDQIARMLGGVAA